MKYSVIIPLYNKEKYIERTLKSVLKQTFEDYEVIVVDDGSTDNSLECARKIQSNKVKIVCQKNAGVAIARNTGIENSSGEYIAFLDADDEWYPNYLETIDNLTIKYPQSAIYVTAYRIVMGDNRFHFSDRGENEDGCLDSYWQTFKHAYDIVWTSATVIKKAAVLEAGKFTPGEKIGQDLDLWARVACINPKVTYSSAVCVDYNRGAEQNARTRVKIAYPKAFLSILEREMKSPRWTSEDKQWMESKYNKKMMVYVFTSIIAGKRKEARVVLRNWGKNHFSKAIPFLRIASFLPTTLNRCVYKMRLKIF